MTVFEKIRKELRQDWEAALWADEFGSMFEKRFLHLLDETLREMDGTALDMEEELEAAKRRIRQIYQEEEKRGRGEGE